MVVDVAEDALLRLRQLVVVRPALGLKVVAYLGYVLKKYVYQWLPCFPFTPPTFKSLD